MPRQILITTTLFALLWSLSFTRAASADTAREIDIPPGDLVTALESLEKQAPVELVFQPDQLRGLITKGVKGNYCAVGRAASSATWHAAGAAVGFERRHGYCAGART